MSKRTVIVTIFLFTVALFVFFQTAKHPKSHVTIDGHVFTTEVVETPSVQQKGLSDRDSLPQDHGMLFLFDKATTRTFWMKGMRFPIDIIFINNDRVVSVVHSAPTPISGNLDLPLYSSKEPSDSVLEINAGLAKKYGFKKNDIVKIEIK